jgi:hypothetical protein
MRGTLDRTPFVSTRGCSCSRLDAPWRYWDVHRLAQDGAVLLTAPGPSVTDIRTVQFKLKLLLTATDKSVSTERRSRLRAITRYRLAKDKALLILLRHTRPKG